MKLHPWQGITLIFAIGLIVFGINVWIYNAFPSTDITRMNQEQIKNQLGQLANVQVDSISFGEVECQGQACYRRVIFYVGYKFGTAKCNSQTCVLGFPP